MIFSIDFSAWFSKQVRFSFVKGVVNIFKKSNHSYTSTDVLLIGPSGVRALPLAAGINKGGHYFRYWSERVACASGAN